MSATARISLFWIVSVAALLWFLPPGRWEGADGLTFVVAVLMLSTLAYAALLVGAGLRWLARCIEGPSAP